MKFWDLYENIGGILKNNVLLLKNFEINYFLKL